MPWFKRWFSDSLYIDLYKHRDVEEARQALDLFVSVCKTTPSSSLVLDLACGTGRHAFELSRRGYRVCAVDLSETLLAVAKKRKTMRHTASLSLVRADMRALPFRQSFDAVVQLFTAFGYFTSDAENIDVVATVASVLHPGGWYMLDFLNADAVRNQLEPYTETRSNGFHITQIRRIENNRVEKEITITDARETRIFHESVRLFSKDELVSIFESCSFDVAHIFGSYNGAPLGPNSSRCILFGRRRT